MIETVEELMEAYEEGTDSHDLEALLPLIDDDAIYLFSNESVHIGKAAVERILRHNFELIQAETYQIENLTWIANSDQVAACVYDYSWSGRIHGQAASGSGRGTTVLKRRSDTWKVVHEHLSRGKFAA
jgi:ketosteroid isomerase-like protein